MIAYINILPTREMANVLGHVDYLCERLVVFTPDLFHKSTPEGLVNNITRMQMVTQILN